MGNTNYFQKNWLPHLVAPIRASKGRYTPNVPSYTPRKEHATTYLRIILNNLAWELHSRVLFFTGIHSGLVHLWYRIGIVLV